MKIIKIQIKLINKVNYYTINNNNNRVSIVNINNNISNNNR